MLEMIVKELHWYKRIEVFRVINGWSQTEAANRCQTYQNIYWRWEKGISYPKPQNKKTLARAFGIKIEDIFSVNDKVAKSPEKKRIKSSY